MKKIILASKSPRRKTLLEQSGLIFEVIPSNYKEEKNEKFSIEFIKKVSYCKAQDVAQSVDFDAIVISADTIVILDSVCLVKPRNSNEAFLCLKKLSNKWHSVVTAVTILDKKNGKFINETLETKVKFRKLNDDEIKKYIEDFNPLDKAGSYGIQDFITKENANNPPPKSFIEKIEGRYENVMGLDCDFTIKLLERFTS